MWLEWWTEVLRGKTWRSCVKRDMKAMGIKEEMAQDRCAWRNITGGPTRASGGCLKYRVCFGVTAVKRIWWYDDDDDAVNLYHCSLKNWGNIKSKFYPCQSMGLASIPTGTTSITQTEMHNIIICRWAGPSFFRGMENWASRRRIFVSAAEFRDATEIREFVVLPRKTT